MKIDAIYFDLDGTLWETVEVTCNSTNEIAKKYKLDEVSKETVANCMGKTKEECAKEYYPNLPLDQAIKIFEESLANVSKKLLKKGGNIYEGVESVLQELQKKYKLGIVSNCADGYIEAFMISSNLGKYFNDIVAAGKKEIKKSEAIKLAIKRDEVKNAIYVGDTIKDKEAAREAGIEFIHAKYGFNNNLKNKYQIQDIRDLPNLLKIIDK